MSGNDKIAVIVRVAGNRVKELRLTLLPKALALLVVLSAASLGGPLGAQEASDHAILADPAGEPIVVGSAHRIQSSVYGDAQLVTVRLPRGYHEDPQRRYPVLFSVDGGPNQDFELLAGIAAEAEHSTSFTPFILIGVKTENRYRQLTPEWTRLPRERLDVAFKGAIVPGGAPTFRDYLARDVIPWATQRYRTDRKILTAASLGGLFVIDTFLEQPEMFDDYIALTPSVWWDGGRIVDEAASKLAQHAPSDRRIYFTMGDEGVGNKTGPWLETLVSAFETNAPEGLKWAFVDRSNSEEHRTMALISWLDSMRTLYLTPSRTGLPLALIFDDFVLPEYSGPAKSNIAAGKCTPEIAKPATFTEKRAAPSAFFGMCLLMKPGSEITAGNFTNTDFGPVARGSD